MVDFALRYDMRQPAFCSASKAEMYTTAIEQCAWAENNGFTTVHLSEHHGSEDNYCPSPLLLATAIAARTEKLALMLSALIAPLHHPIKLAEDLSVLDIISKGRLIPILSAGYRAEEFRAFGRELRDRKSYMDNIVPLLNSAWSGKPFDHEGVSVTVTPTPHSVPRPMLFMGGSSRAAARRAAKHADFFIPSGPEIFEMYREELVKLGKDDPGPMPKAPSSVFFVAEDKDQYWEQIAPHLQHETNIYASWAEQAEVFTPYKHFDNIDDLRASEAYRLFTPNELVDFCRNNPKMHLLTHPMCGGISPDTAWQSLLAFSAKVLPALREENLVA
ncbi:MAG: LLM class flavin-dependent oxidoreductase [Pseudomonadales bacterium]